MFESNGGSMDTVNLKAKFCSDCGAVLIGKFCSECGFKAGEYEGAVSHNQENDLSENKATYPSCGMILKYFK